MTKIHRTISSHFSSLNTAQKNAVSNIDGPLLIIAGPGSGKTLVLVARTLNILQQKAAEPHEIVLCTFTEKAAFELRDRVAQGAHAIGYTGDLSRLHVGTIHGLCHQYLNQYRHHTSLGHGFEVLDELTQSLFLYEHFETIIGEPASNGLFLGKWKTKWTTIDGVKSFFDKITEELVDPQKLVKKGDPLVAAIGAAYIRYEECLQEKNILDFAHLQKQFVRLFEENDIAKKIQAEARYVMVDEYQDTNYIQEQLLMQLALPQNNLCVVGDDDQSLYRFRGATVRNILEFGVHFPKCSQVKLTVNYRSHQDIVAAYDKYMAAFDWSNPDGEVPFRHDKTIEPNPDGDHTDYPAVLSIWGASEADEADRLADMVAFLKKNKVIEDYNQVAVLLRSVRGERSTLYIEALERHGIPAFAPRARAYFESEPVRWMVACFAILLGWYGDQRGELKGPALVELGEYVEECIKLLARAGAVRSHPLAKLLQRRVAEIEALTEGQTLNRHLGDYLYEFLSFEPFAPALDNENNARNLAIFSQLLAVFQHYYHYSVITHKNRGFIRLHLFNSFLRFLHEGGINEYEDPDQPFPSGYVQLMTIHQSKGLEFPVVIVGSLSANINSGHQVDELLGPFYQRALLEPLKRITPFDRMRLHYVAFSRAERLLVLTTTEDPKGHFDPIWQGLPQWPHVKKSLLAAQRFTAKQRMPVKKTFSFTSHVKVYETCPRQYQFFRDYAFTPARSAEMFFGALVHQTIEDVHRWVLDGQALKLVKNAIPGLFDTNFRGLINAGYRPINDAQRDNALQQVNNYYAQNQDRMRQVIETEVDVSYEKESYILTGKVDLLLGKDDKLELLDFKSQPRPAVDVARLDHYYQQLLVYAHILEHRYHKYPERLGLYWTGEAKRDDALMVFPYKPERVTAAGEYFDSVVAHIQARDFAVKQLPEKKVCAECDIRSYCNKQGTIKLA